MRSSRGPHSAGSALCVGRAQPGRSAYVVSIPVTIGGALLKIRSARRHISVIAEDDSGEATVDARQALDYAWRELVRGTPSAMGALRAQAAAKCRRASKTSKCLLPIGRTWLSEVTDTAIFSILTSPLALSRSESIRKYGTVAQPAQTASFTPEQVETVRRLAKRAAILGSTAAKEARTVDATNGVSWAEGLGLRTNDARKAEATLAAFLSMTNRANDARAAMSHKGLSQLAPAARPAAVRSVVCTVLYRP